MRAFRIPAALLVVASLVFLGCSDTQPVSPEPGSPSFSRSSSGKGSRKSPQEGDPAVLALMHQINEQLAARGSNLFVNEIEAFTIGLGRPIDRILQQPSRWVPSDTRRPASGNDITYLVDMSEGATTSGLSSAETEAAIDGALSTWDTTVRCSKVNIVKNADGGADPDIFDSFFGFGGFGNPFLADITNAGWLPGLFFDAVFGFGAKDFVLAFSVPFIFIDPSSGNPTDINNDQYLDTALSEVYYNDNFGLAGGAVAGNPWAIDGVLPAIDVETVALHENGHSLSSGHFGPPPTAVMNVPYDGLRQALFPIDNAGHCTFFARWPNN